MNTAYNYKNERNNIIDTRLASKKGMAKVDTMERENSTDIIEKILTALDNLTDSLNSARALIIAKAVFAFIALLGLLGVIGGIELGTVSLISGSIALALIVGLEFIILRD